MLAMVVMERNERRLKSSQTRLQAIFATSPTPLLVGYWQGSDYATDQVNPAWERQFQIPAAKIAGLSGRDFSWWVSAQDRARFLEQAHRGEGVSQFMVWLRRMDGSHFLGSISCHTEQVRGRQMIVMAYDDVTLSYRMQQQLQELNRTLEERVARAADELIQSEKLAALGQLVAGVAHELSTPIGNALLAASTLEAEIRQLEQAHSQGLRRSDLEQFLQEGSMNASVMQRNLERAVSLIGSFRQVAVDRTTSQVRKCSLRQVTDEALLLIQPLLKGSPHRVQVEIPEDLQLVTCPGSLTQILINLVQNALLHAFTERQSGLIRIQAYSLNQECLLVVSDDGCGISADMQQRVFEPFFTTRMGQGGSGLGLHLVHNLVTGVLEGRIRLVSEPGQGCRFELTIPGLQQDVIRP
ncbi:His Kinase A (phospho-acceptor) domain-containing protein [Marinospirillum alkaliphilum DSM 21637]|uniref:histidine kinase n=2 Tax=Marinospirillum TaxID=64968 RepID=A0A1K1WAX9_9GAMM|nr:His Kinase A (phospho-acceptor) domain-containing protein [Marinospirillum alkaliphilum DSM 21637]